MTSGNLRDKYCPARIYHATIPNQGHIQPLELHNEHPTKSKPKPPTQPVFPQVKDWKPLKLTLGLAFLLLIPNVNVLGFFGLIGLWVWALIEKFPKYKSAKKKADLIYQKHLDKYEVALNRYKEAVLPKWEEERESYTLQQKTRFELTKTIINQVWKQKSWRVHSLEEIKNTRAQDYIGPGEDDLVNVLTNIKEIHTFHQVEIEPRYTADIVCLNLKSGKLCVVEVDGSQHWQDSKQIERDDRRMARLAAKGVPTIRFMNKFAEKYPHECVRHIQKLLS